MKNSIIRADEIVLVLFTATTVTFACNENFLFHSLRKKYLVQTGHYTVEALLNSNLTLRKVYYFVFLSKKSDLILREIVESWENFVYKKCFDERERKLISEKSFITLLVFTCLLIMLSFENIVNYYSQGIFILFPASSSIHFFSSFEKLT